MKCLHIQVQPELLNTCKPEPCVDALVNCATACDPDAIVDVEHGHDDGPYINVNIYTDGIPSLWAAIRREIMSNPPLSSATIVCCEGQNGWDEHLLLHHYDKAERLDQLP